MARPESPARVHSSLLEATRQPSCDAGTDGVPPGPKLHSARRATLGGCRAGGPAAHRPQKITAHPKKTRRADGGVNRRRRRRRRRRAAGGYGRRGAAAAAAARGGTACRPWRCTCSSGTCGPGRRRRRRRRLRRWSRRVGLSLSVRLSVCLSVCLSVSLPPTPLWRSGAGPGGA